MALFFCHPELVKGQVIDYKTVLNNRGLA